MFAVGYTLTEDSLKSCIKYRHAPVLSRLERLHVFRPRGHSTGDARRKLGQPERNPHSRHQGGSNSDDWPGRAALGGTPGWLNPGSSLTSVRPLPTQAASRSER